MNELEKARKELLDMVFDSLIPQFAPFTKTTFDYFQLRYDIKEKSQQIMILENENNPNRN